MNPPPPLGATLISSGLQGFDAATALTAVLVARSGTTTVRGRLVNCSTCVVVRGHTVVTVLHLLPGVTGLRTLFLLSRTWTSTMPVPPTSSDARTARYHVWSGSWVSKYFRMVGSTGSSVMMSETCVSRFGPRNVTLTWRASVLVAGARVQSMSPSFTVGRSTT